MCWFNGTALVQAEAKGLGWFRAGTKVAYYQRAKQYTLTFTVTFPYDSDRCYMAHCFPYTYSDLQVFLSELCSDPAKQSILCRRDLCQSLAGNSVDLLTITQVINQLNPHASARAEILCHLDARGMLAETGIMMLLCLIGGSRALSQITHVNHVLGFGGSRA